MNKLIAIGSMFFLLSAGTILAASSEKAAGVTEDTDEVSDLHTTLEVTDFSAVETKKPATKKAEAAEDADEVSDLYPTLEVTDFSAVETKTTDSEKTK